MRVGKFLVSHQSGGFDSVRVPTPLHHSDTVLSSPQILHVPLLLLANKQDMPDALTVEDIRENYEGWWQRRHQSGAWETEDQPQRVASLDVMGVSGLDGWVAPLLVGAETSLTLHPSPVEGLESRRW